MSGQHGARVRVTSSRRGATTARRRPLAASLVEQTGAGELYLRGLLRAQLRLALLVLAGLALVLGGIPVLYAVLPAARDVRLAGVPVVWPVLAVLVYPVLVALAAWYTRAATRVERRLSATAQER
ncbi:hypothetical protein BJF80_05210 [Serinicoccus sp. CUA-874]|uniref:hypothetical protein n=1 Tax=Serinicoccus sp. CUA-874 TaxID=1517939 RepID=UPI00095B4207|nr:hypothetical protein [Serinicoccus sp. CUA-874]OLT16728.1 hypothetical protein BJF80_05210 [Serinicoccus sp. CUA-874]